MTKPHPNSALTRRDAVLVTLAAAAFAVTGAASEMKAETPRTGETAVPFQLAF